MKKNLTICNLLVKQPFRKLARNEIFRFSIANEYRYVMCTPFLSSKSHDSPVPDRTN